MYDVVEKEAQILRDYSKVNSLPPPLLFVPNYGKDNITQFNFYFRVRDFTRRTKSGVSVYSPPWYIEKLNTCLRGCVTFLPNGNLDIWLYPGRNPKLVGLPPKDKYSYKYKVSVVTDDVDKEKMIKEEYGHGAQDEKEEKVHAEWGNNIGCVSCESLEKEGYIEWDALLLKYDISIV